MLPVPWGTYNDGDEVGIAARRFDSANTLIGSEFQVNGYTTGEQNSPTVAADAAGNFVVTWESREQDGSGAALTTLEAGSGRETDESA